MTTTDITDIAAARVRSPIAARRIILALARWTFRPLCEHISGACVARAEAAGVTHSTNSGWDFRMLCHRHAHLAAWPRRRDEMIVWFTPGQIASVVLLGRRRRAEERRERVRDDIVDAKAANDVR